MTSSTNRSRSLRAELVATGLAVPKGFELRDCDRAARFVAYALVHEDIDEPLPGDLLDALETFDDLAHFANVRGEQEGRTSAWTA